MAIRTVSRPVFPNKANRFAFDLIGHTHPADLSSLLAVANLLGEKVSSRPARAVEAGHGATPVMHL